jgi:hypothetical protein
MCEVPVEVGGVHVERFPAIAVSQDGGSWAGDSLPMYLHMFAYRPMLTWPMGLRSEATHGRDLISRRVTG